MACEPRLKDLYQDGECPDCGEEIPDDAEPGCECKNCGHVFWLDTPNDDA